MKKLKSGEGRKFILYGGENMEISKYKTQADFDNLNAEEQRELLKQAKNGNLNAKNKLIKSCMSLGISVAMKYAKNNNLEDAIQESYLGLVEAIDEFDLDYDVKFSSYATYHAKSRVLNYLYKDNKMSIPRATYKNAMKYKKEKSRLSSKLEKSITVDDMIEHTNYNREDCLLFEKCLEKILSYDFLIELTGNEQQNEEINFSDTLQQKIIMDKVESQLKELPQLQQDLIKDYYGIEGKDNSLRNLSKKYDYSHEKIRQLINEAVSHIKNNIETIK